MAEQIANQRLKINQQKGHLFMRCPSVFLSRILEMSCLSCIATRTSGTRINAEREERGKLLIFHKQVPDRFVIDRADQEFDSADRKENREVCHCRAD